MGTVGTDGGAGGLLGERSDVELLTAHVAGEPHAFSAMSSIPLSVPPVEPPPEADPANFVTRHRHSAGVLVGMIR